MCSNFYIRYEEAKRKAIISGKEMVALLASRASYYKKH